MNRLAVFAFVLSFCFAGEAFADFRIQPTEGVYGPLSCLVGPEVDMAQSCLYRMDVGNEADLGCVPATPNQVVVFNSFTLTVTPGSDAEIRCTAVDTSGNESVPSLNAAIADFTPPGPPSMVMPATVQVSDDPNGILFTATAIKEQP